MPSVNHIPYSKWIWILSSLCLLTFAVGVSWVSAQEGQSATLLHKSIIITREQAELYAYIQSDSAVQEETLTLDGQRVSPSRYDIRRLNQDPFYLIVLYDVSGSMQPTTAAMQDQVDALLGAVPLNTQIAFYRFSDVVQLEAPFAEKQQASSAFMSAVDNIQPSTNGTCLYDSLSHVIEAADQVVPDAPRRAVLLLSDGRDQKVQGQDENCSVRNKMDVINEASGLTPPLPIYTLGFQGNNTADEESLAELANETGGYYAFEDGDMLFDQLNNYFASQWLLTAVFNPDRGPHEGQMTFITADGTQLDEDFAFTAEEDLRIPVIEPDILQIKVEEFYYEPRKGIYEAQIAFSDPQVARKQNWLIRITDLGLDPDEVITPTFPITQVIRINDSQPQAIDIFNPIAEHPQPLHHYKAEVIPSGRLTNEFVLTTNEAFVWPAPASPEVAIDAQISRLFRQQLVVTYTLNYPQYIDLIEGYVWEDDNLEPSAIFTITVPEANQLEVTKVTEPPISIRPNFGQYRITTYLKRGDNYLPVQVPVVIKDNTVRAWLTGWLDSGFRRQLMIPSLILLATVLVLYGLLLLWRSSQRPRIAAVTSPLPTTTQQNTAVPTAISAFRVVSSPDKSHLGQDILLNGHDDLFYIGREECDFNLEADRLISRQHVAIEQRTDGVYVIDLGSKNGTFVDGKPIPANKRHRLERQSELMLGKYTRITFS